MDENERSGPNETSSRGAPSAGTPEGGERPPDPVRRHAERKTCPPSLASAQLLEELRSRSRARRTPTEGSPERLAAPACPASTPPTASSSPGCHEERAMPRTEGGLSVCSLELLRELKQSRSLRHVAPRSGLTTVFSGRGRAGGASEHPSAAVDPSQVPVPPKASTNEDRAVLASGERQ